MALFKSGNPALGESTFKGLAQVGADEETMTLQGTVNRTALLLAALFASAAFTWSLYSGAHDIMTVSALMWAGLLGGFVVALVIIFKKTLAPYLAIVYAVLEGLLLGGLSAMLDASYPGIAFGAFLLTVGITGALLVTYTTRLIAPSANFKLAVAAATGGIAIYYLISLGLSLFGIHAPLVNDNSWVGIGFSLVVVVIASLNLVVDFDFIEQGALNNAPRYMEWYGAFSLLVTLVWLYIELLRLLSKLRSRD